MAETTNELAQIKEENTFLEIGRQTMYCSLNTTDDKGKAQLYKAMNNPEEKLKDHIGETLEVVDVFCEVVDIADENTGEIVKAPRIVLFTKNGKTYGCVSKGIANSVSKLIAVFGEPTWGGLKLQVKQLSLAANKNVLTLELV